MKYARVSHASRSWIPRPASSFCHRHAIGRTVRTMIATEATKYSSWASRRMSSVLPRSIFQRMYAVQSPVTTSVAERRIDRRLMP